MVIDDDNDYHMVDCQVMERYEREDDITNKHRYVVKIDVKKTVENATSFHDHYLIIDVPRGAIEFIEKPYTSDVFLKNAFRHEMKLPDEIFPKPE
eukprot:scaffold4495_cov117-Skeletonema_dohrnii-CCMP3373.AAC.1